LNKTNKGVDKFLKRQQIARYMNREKKIYEMYSHQGKGNLKDGSSMKRNIKNDSLNKHSDEDQSE